MAKYAFFTMDTESYYDTSCVRESNLTPQPEFSCKEEIKTFAELLQKYNAKGTFFVTGEFVPQSMEYLKYAVQNSHALGLHSYKHVSPLTQPLTEFDEDIKRSIDLFKNELGTAPKGYRAPCFGIDEDRLSVIKKYGFTYDSSSLGFSRADNSGVINLESYKKINDVVYEKDSFYELKICLVNFFGKMIPVSGGAYLRLTPWFLSKYLVKKYIKNADAYMFYVHPFEISKKKLPLDRKMSFAEKLFIIRGRKSYLGKIEKIIKMLKKQGYSIITVEDFIGQEVTR